METTSARWGLANRERGLGEGFCLIRGKVWIRFGDSLIKEGKATNLVRQGEFRRAKRLVGKGRRVAMKAWSIKGEGFGNPWLREC